MTLGVLKDKAWLRSVRKDLDSDAAMWVRPSPSGISKAEAIASYLDRILTELGYPAPPHRCPDCGQEHERAQP